jgi:hypothetical protein
VLYNLNIMSESPKSNEGQVVEQVKQEDINIPESIPQSSIPEEMTVHLDAENIPKGWTTDDIFESLHVSTLEQYQDFSQKMAKRLGKEDYEIDEELLDIQKKAFSSLGEYMSWNMFDLGAWETLEAGINKEKQLDKIQKKELAVDWDEVVSTGDSMREARNKIAKIDEKLAELEKQKKPSKDLLNPQKPSVFDQLKDVFGSSKDSAMAYYREMLKEDEATKQELQQIEEHLPEINAEIEELKKQQNSLVPQEGIATKRYEDLRQFYFAKAEAVFKEIQPILEKENQEKKQKFEQTIGYLYNALYYQTIPKDPNDWVGYLDKNGVLPADYQEPQTPEYLTSTTDRITFIKKDLVDGSGLARDFLLQKLNQRESERLIKEITGVRVELH